MPLPRLLVPLMPAVVIANLTHWTRVRTLPPPPTTTTTTSTTTSSLGREQTQAKVIRAKKRFATLHYPITMSPFLSFFFTLSLISHLLSLIFFLPSPSSSGHQGQGGGGAGGGITLHDCLKAFTSLEELDENSWYCDHCRKLSSGSVTSSLSRLPDILILHIKVSMS